MAGSRKAACRRRVLACARCRTQKIGCDRGNPCDNCKTARTTCVGFSSVAGGIVVPKSIVLSLEERLARARSSLEASNINTDSAPPVKCYLDRKNHTSHPTVRPLTTPADLLHMPSDLEQDQADDVARIAASSELQAVLSAFAPDASSVADAVSSVKIGLAPSLPLKDPPSRSFESRVSIHYLSRLPREIIKGLIHKYISQILPTYPCLDASNLWRQLAMVLNLLDNSSRDALVEGINPTADIYFVYMVLAVATNSPGSGRQRDKRREDLARLLSEEGLRHWSRNSAFASDLVRVQAILVILQYAFIDPAAASVWVLSGAVLRLCINFGLHHENSLGFEHDAAELELRRRVFWTAYCADRTICAVMQRPLSLLDEAITTRLPANLILRSGDLAHGPGGDTIDSTGFKSWIEYNRIQSEILQYHLHGLQLPGVTTQDTWMRDVEHRIESWYCGRFVGRDTIEVDRARALVNLHRPSSRVPCPSIESLEKAYQAAILAAKAYKEFLRCKLTLNAWQTAHDLLGMSMVVLFCLRHGFSHIRQGTESAALLEDTKLFTINLVSLSEQGWPELLQYAKRYERLLSRLLDPILSPDQTGLPTFTGVEDAELAHLLHLGSSELEKQRNESSTSIFEQDMSLFDIDFSEWIDTDALQTDPVLE